MKATPPLLVAVCILAALSACSNAVLDPKYERNPEPRQKYVVTATVDGAPGPFEVATAGAQYVIGPTQTCMPSAEPISGTFPTPSRAGTSAQVRKLPGDRFEFDIYLDAMRPKDYFGKGVCTWVVEGVSIRLKARNATNEREFVAFLDQEQLLGQQPVVLYARGSLYGKVPGAYDETEEAIEEQHAASRYGTDAGTLFKITLQSQESVQ
ncbi:hypothetical protein K4L06_06210 [Lysobacter sp. BMK333-48F3]|uniref:hypothetical protein n=1 Tax=Lysobacter sp. BMK333-48F3 TaxID=2867962 RepID=UPI001C8C3640|nr:hypothetical protein [Lysobacter sp. BMK333-48F3]MBX9400900.1 hypothetical protein [Lysobacter sp. BMK333-48F3]